MTRVQFRILAVAAMSLLIPAQKAVAQACAFGQYTIDTCWTTTPYTPVIEGDAQGLYGVGVLGMASDGGAGGIAGNQASNVGVYGQGWGAAHGVVGLTDAGVGVLGYSNWSYAVEGLSANSDGLHGYSNGYGDEVWAKSVSGDGVYGESTNSYAVEAYSSSHDAVYAHSTSAYGVYATSSSSDGVYGYSGSDNGVLGYGLAWNGVEGDCYANASGVSGASHYAGGIGVYASSDYYSGHTQYAIWSAAHSGDYGLYTPSGNVYVGGTLSKANGTFLIDHPLDPANKYLSHSFVESPDQKNVYDGTVILDGNGQATVQLPGYFEALNTDFRYQLTSIGRFAPVYVASEVSNNAFTIAGGTAGQKILMADHGHSARCLGDCSPGHSRDEQGPGGPRKVSPP